MMIHAGKEALVEQLGDYEHIEGRVANCEPLEALCQRVGRRVQEFLEAWEKDAVFAFALYSTANPECLQSEHFHSLVESGHIQAHELDAVLVTLLECSLRPDPSSPDEAVEAERVKRESNWRRIRRRAFKLSRVVYREFGWYVAPKTGEWFARNGSGFQPRLFEVKKQAA